MRTEYEKKTLKGCDQCKQMQMCKVDRKFTINCKDNALQL